MMHKIITYNLTLFFLLYFFLFSGNDITFAGNIDPSNNGSKYAYGENIGWINLEPTTGGGVTVADTAITGYAWGENIGWVNMSPLLGGVVNDGNGNLSGYAWSENSGWINFNPAGGGVYIDSCGDFNGFAWGENIGWIKFRSEGVSPFKVNTSWRPLIDTIVPIVTPDLPLKDWYNAGDVYSISAPDCGAGIREIRYSLDGSPEVVVNGSLSIVDITTDGTYTLSFYAVDNAGNIGKTTTQTINIDRTPPDISIVTPVNGTTYLANEFVPASFTVTDNISGIAAQSSTTADGSIIDTSVAGLYTFTVSATDYAGNSCTVSYDYTVQDITIKLAASDGQADDLFGAFVGISGDRALISSYGDDDNGIDSGSVYFFDRDPSTGIWTEHSKALPTDGVAGDRFGVSVAISGNTALIGADLDDTNGPDTGSVYVYLYDPATGVWNDTQELTAGLDGHTGDNFGGYIALSGDNAIIGAQWYDIGSMQGTGAAYIYRPDPVTGVWDKFQRILADNAMAGDWFGAGVAIDGGTAMIGAIGDDDDILGVDSGSVYVYEFDQVSETWVFLQKLTALGGQAGDQFGYSISVSGDTAIVGSSLHDNSNGLNAGSVYIFDRDPVTGTWSQTQELIASNGLENDWFGGSVVLNGDQAFIGAVGADAMGINSGSVYHYLRNQETGEWVELNHYTATDGSAEDFFSTSLALSNNNLLVGAYGDDDIPTGRGVDSGSAYLMSFSSSGNSPPVADNQNITTLIDTSVNIKLAGSDPDGDTLGFGITAAPVNGSLSLSPSLLNILTGPLSVSSDNFGGALEDHYGNLLVGASLQDEVYLYDRQRLLQVAIPKPTPFSNVVELFGWSVASFDRNRFIVGAPSARIDVPDSRFSQGFARIISGAVYLYDNTGTLLKTINNPEPEVSSDDLDQFGYSVAAVPTPTGTNFMVGTPLDNPGGLADAGSVYLFDSCGTLIKAIRSPNPTINDWFGKSVAASTSGGESFFVVGTRMSRTLHIYDATTGDLLLTIPHPDQARGALQFGDNIDIVDDKIVVSDSNVKSPDNLSTGAVYVLDRRTGALLLTIRNPVLYPNVSSGFGSGGVKWHNGEILVAALTGEDGTGSVYIFDGTTGEQKGVIKNPDPLPPDTPFRIGTNLELFGNHMAVTSVDTNTAQLGKVNIFDASFADWSYAPDAGFAGDDSFTFEVDDGEGGMGTGTVNVTVEPGPNYPPTANAGSDVSVFLGEVATLRGQATDPEGYPITLWVWSVESKPAGSTISFSPGPTSQITDFTADTSGDYLLTMSACDAGGCSLADPITVSIVENQPPVAVAIADVVTGTAPLVVNFDGSGSSDPEGGALLYDWTFGNVTTPSSNMSPAHTYTNPGTYTALLTVIDDKGQGSIDTIIITVIAQDASAPTAVDDTATTDIDIPVVVDVVANDTDPGGGPLTLIYADSSSNRGGQVTLNLDNTVTYTPKPGAVYTHTDTFNYVIENAAGGRDIGTVSVTVVGTPPPPPQERPVANAGPDVSLFLGETVVLQGSAIDANNDPITTWVWSVSSKPVGSGTNFAPNQLVATPTFLADSLGDYVLSLQVCDAFGCSTPDYVTISYVENQPPVAVAMADVVTGTAPLVVNFDGSGSYDPEGGALLYDWTFGDVTTPTSSMSTAHTYFNPGTYTALLTVIDDRGQGSIDTITITVIDPNNPPVAMPLATPSTGQAPLTVQFTANASDPDGDLLSYAWNFGNQINNVNTSSQPNPTHIYARQGRYTATLKVHDGRGGIAHRTLMLIVVDRLPPIITPPADIIITVPTGTLVPLVDLGTASAIDYIDGAIAPTSDQTGPFAPGSYTIAWSATDSSGNTGTATQNVRINTPSEVFDEPLPGGGGADISVPLGQEITRVSISQTTPTIPGVAFVELTPGVQDSVGTLSYTTTVSRPGFDSTTTVTFNYLLPPDITLFKVDEAGNAVLLPQAGADSSWTRTDDPVAGTTTFVIVIRDGGPYDLNGLVDGIVIDPVAFGRIFNHPPTADGGVDRSFECVTMSCAVTLSAEASTDPDSTDVSSDIIDYLWYEDYVEGGINTPIAMGEVVNLNLTLGDHLITLAVEDSIGHIATDTFTVSINPAALSLLELTKAEIEWDKSKVKLSGKIALPVGRTPYDVNAIGSVSVDIPGLGEVVSGSAAFTVEGSDSMKWEYEPEQETTGLSEFKIDWKGAKFDYEQSGLHLKTSHMGQSSTSLEIEREGITGAFSLTVEGVTIDVDSTGMATTTSPGVSIDVDDDGEIEVELPFALLSNMTITLAGAVADSIPVANYYTAAVGKFKVEGRFHQSGADLGTLIPELNLVVSLGSEGFSGGFTVISADWKEVEPSEWKYKRDK